MGRCPDCGEWGSLNEELIAAEVARSAGRPIATRSWVGGGAAGAGAGIRRATGRVEATPTPIATVQNAAETRFGSGLPELDRVLADGFVPGASYLLAGEPGIGKSTLLLQSLARVAATRTVLYATAEESTQALRGRGERLGALADRLLVLGESEIGALLEGAAAAAPALLVIDSVQATFCPDLAGAPGTVSQVREAALAAARFGREIGCAVVLLGHITKEGGIAGPKVLEHLVDVVLMFGGDRHYPYRVLRCVKNRFGPTGEVGIFEMTGSGLQSVANPSALFLTERPHLMPGSAVTCVLTGVRPILLEMQALVGDRASPSPRRVIQGADQRRVSFLLAVLEKALGLPLSQRDVFVNVVGGMRVDEPAADLAICLAILSSARKEVLPPDLVAIGEVGLTGELRRVDRLGARLRESADLGFCAAAVPAGATAAAAAGTTATTPADNEVADARASLRLFPLAHLRDSLGSILSGAEAVSDPPPQAAGGRRGTLETRGEMV